MSDERGTLESIGRHLALAFAPLKDAVASKPRFVALMRDLGWNATDLPPAYTALGTAVDEALSALDTLGDPPTIAQVETLLGAVRAAYEAMRGIAIAPPGVDATAFVAEAGERLGEFLLVRYLESELPAAYGALSALGVIEVERVPAANGRPSFVRTHFKWQEIPKIVSDPGSIPARVYGWGTPKLDTDRIVHHLASVLATFAVPVRTEFPRDASVRAWTGTTTGVTPMHGPSLVMPFYATRIADQYIEAAFVLHELPASGGEPPGIVIEPRVPSQVPLSVPLGGGISLDVQAGTNVASTVGVLVRPSGISVKYPFEPGTTPPSAGIGAAFDFAPNTATLLLGAPKQTRIELKGASLGFSASSVNGTFDAVLAAQLKGLALVLAAGSGDSFLHSLLGDGESRLDLSLTLEWSRAHGLRLSGSGGFEVAAHPHLTLGPVTIDEIDVRVAVPATQPPDLVLEVGAAVKGEIGPLIVVVQGIGFKVAATFTRGNAGPLDLTAGFKAPTGVGLEVDAGGFKGGGFLSYDSAKGAYAGALELEFQSFLTVKAIGILDTKTPDGASAYSLLIIITSEFPPIQLSFGFTLLGVGGLLGVNRTADYDALRAGVRDGSIESALFPRDIIANAPRIIADLRRILPPLPGRFLVGPMAKLGWGTPTMAYVELALVLEIPRPSFAILGVLRVALPADNAPLLVLQVNFLGIVDLGKAQISFDASLYDSHALTFALTGDMSVRVALAGDTNFLLTVGGFHPAYVPPPLGLPALRRLSIDLCSGAPRIRADAYFAVTSNTLQFGAKLEVSAGVSVFGVYGFMAFDALITRSPFHFVAAFSAMLAVKSGSSTLFSVRVDATLEGPRPWHAHGRGSFEIGFVFTITIHVNFDVTFGDPLLDLLPSLAVLPLLVDALSDPNNWRSVLPDATAARVTLRGLTESGEALVLHPFGALEVAQKVVPLGLAIARVGAQPTQDGTTFRIDEVTLGTQATAVDPVLEAFAPAQFLDLSDSEKLARKSFERYGAGVRLAGGTAANADDVVAMDVVYEVIYVPERQAPTQFRLGKLRFDALARTAAVARSRFAFAARAPSALATPNVTVAGERFGVASTDDLTLSGANLVFASEAEARQALHAIVAADPGRAGALQVMPMAMLEAA